jgi:hypothetical protein
MGSILIVITLVGFFLQYRTQQISHFLHINQMFVYFILFALLLVGVVMEIDARK